MSLHRANYRRYLNTGKRYITSVELLKHDDHYIELVQLCPCSNKEELHAHEGQIIRNTPTCVNRVIAGRDKKQWYADNEQKIKQYQKQYRVDHKQEIKEKDKQYYADNKERIDAHRSVKYMCLCRGTYSRRDKAAHEKSKRHQAFITWLKEFSVEQGYDFLKDI
jgi:hypothetical protein